MKHLYLKKSMCVVLALLLAAAVLCLNGCKNDPAPAETDTDATGEVVSFTFEVTGEDGETTSQTVTTTCKTVGEALLEKGLIEGEDGQYGLYVKTVLGETHDYETDGLYWAFYIDGDYALSGVDVTEIVPGTVYGFCAE